jgi:fibronectin-binding autotransporter adhesin
MNKYLNVTVLNTMALAFLVASGAVPSTQAATTYIWNVASPGVNNWNVNGNWNVANYPGFGGSTTDAATFGSVGTAASETVDNEVSVNTTIGALNYTNTASGNWHVTDIPAGVTLTVNGPTVIGGYTVNSLATDVGFTDAGTLALNGNLTVGDAGTSANEANTLDFSSLSNLVVNAGATGTVLFGLANYSQANVKLAGVSNNITAATIDDNITSASSSSSSTFSLGAGTNLFNVGTYDMAYGRDSLTVSFPGSTGGWRIRGTNGTDTDLANLTMGFHNTSGSGSHATCTFNLDGHPLDWRLGTLTMGQANATPTGASYGVGNINFDTGYLFANTVLMGINVGSVASSGTYFAYGQGEFTIGASGTLTIGSGGMSLVNQTNGTITSPCTGTVTLNGGTMVCSNSVLKASTAGTGTINMNSGTIDMVSGTIGSNGVPIDMIYLGSGTLHLNVNGSPSTALVYGTTVSAGGATITIDSISNITGVATVHLISYNAADGDPYASLTLAPPLPGGYTGTLLDDAGSIDLSLTPPGVKVQSVLWAGTPNNNWNYTTANWLGTNGIAVTYTNPDDVHFDDTARSSSVSLTANFTPGALTFTNQGVANGGLDYTLSGPGSIGGAVGLIKDGAGSVTLAETGGDNFSDGITVVNGTVVLDDTGSGISGAVAVNYNATLQIGNSDANGNLPGGGATINGTLVFDQTSASLVSAAIGGAGAVTLNGTGTVALSANDQYTGATTINAGTLALTGTGSISNSSQVTVGSATLDVSGVTGLPAIQTLNIANATIAMGFTNLQPLYIYNSLTMGGPGNTLNVTNLPPIAIYPSTLTLIQSAGISGFNLTVGSLPPGYSGTLSESADTTAVLLTLTGGPVGVRPNVTWVGTDALDNVSTNWSDAINWELPGAPTPSDAVIFNQAGSVSGSPFSTVGDGPGGIQTPANINNIVDRNFSLNTLTYTNVAGTYQNTFINSGTTLNITNTLMVGSETLSWGASKEFVTIAGTNGTLSVANTNGVLFVGLGSSQATLDMSGLGTFDASVGTFLVGVGSSSDGIPLGEESGIVYLALTNAITASGAVAANFENDTIATAVALDVGDNDGNAGSSCALYLGKNNTINADAIAIGRQKPDGTLAFNPNLDPNITAGMAIPWVYFRGVSSNIVANWSIGDQGANSGSGESATGTADFTGGYVNALVGTLYVGRTAANATGSGNATGTLSLDNGIFNVNTLYAGYEPSNYSKSATGTVNVETNASLGTSATLAVSGSINLGVTGGGGIQASGTLNISGGTVTAGGIVCGISGTTSAISLNGGTLAVGTAGSPAAPISSLILGGGTLLVDLNGAAGVTNIVAASLSVNAATTLGLNSVTAAAAGVSYPLLSYTGGDPFTSFTVLPLPSGYVGSFIDDAPHNLISVRFTTVPNPLPAHITSVSVLGTTLNITATNGLAGGQYVLVGATNLTMPVSQWVPLLTNTFNASGGLNLSTNIINPAVPQEFFRVAQ